MSRFYLPGAAPPRSDRAGEVASLSQRLYRTGIPAGFSVRSRLTGIFPVAYNALNSLVMGYRVLCRGSVTLIESARSFFPEGGNSSSRLLFFCSRILPGDLGQ